jgi:hypothetical protein
MKYSVILVLKVQVNYIPDEAEASSSSDVRNQYDVILWHRSIWMLHIHLVTSNES